MKTLTATITALIIVSAMFISVVSAEGLTIEQASKNIRYKRSAKAVQMPEMMLRMWIIENPYLSKKDCSKGFDYKCSYKNYIRYARKIK
jgi:hypothetical protein